MKPEIAISNCKNTMKFLDKQQIYKVYLENRSKMTE